MDEDGDTATCVGLVSPGGEIAGPVAEDVGEKLKFDVRSEGVATGGAEGKALKLADGEVDKAAEDALESELDIADDAP